MSSSVLKKAIDLVTVATEEDKNKNFEQALRCYQNALEYFLHAIKYEVDNPETKEKIRVKCQIYLDRAGELEDYIAKKPIAEGMESIKPDFHMSRSKSSNEDEDEDEGIDPESKQFLNHFNSVVDMEKPDIKWYNVAGLEDAKKLLEEAFIFPIKHPHLFTGKRKPWRGILLFGPPGTGKSYLVKALATQVKNTTLFSVSAYTFICKWIREGEKLMRTLFQRARECKPSIVFIDDVEVLWASSSGIKSENAHHTKTELLGQMKRRESESNNDGILFLGATSKPWDLDPTMKQVFEKQIYISLPEKAARVEMFKRQLGNTHHLITDEEMEELARRTEGYSGSDINVVVRDGLMQPIRKIQTAIHFRRVRGPSKEDLNLMVDDLLTPCTSNAPGAMEMNWMDVPGNKLLEPMVTMFDMEQVVANSKPSISEDDLKKFQEFAEDFGVEG